MKMATTQKGSIFGDLEKFAQVCCDVLDGKLDVDDRPPKLKEESVVDLVAAVKFANVALKFPTRKRSALMIPREEEQNVTIKITTSTNKIRHNNDSSVLPPKKRPRFDVDEDGWKRYEEVKTGVEIRATKRRKSNSGNKNSGKKGVMVGPEEVKTGVEISTTKRRKSNSCNKNSGKKGVMVGPDPAPAMPENLMEMVVREFDVTTVTLVVQKSLFKTDLERGENRLSMTLKQIKTDDFLTEEEKRTLERRRQDNHKEGIEVRFIEPNKNLSETEMELKKWDLNNSSSYVLTHNWFRVAHRNGLKEKEIVQIWFFRSRDGKPCFALVNLGREGASSSSSSSASAFGGDDHERSDRSTVTAA